MKAVFSYVCCMHTTGLARISEEYSRDFLVGTGNKRLICGIYPIPFETAHTLPIPQEIGAGGWNKCQLVTIT